MDRECVHAALQFTDQCRVDHAVALEPALPSERLRHDIDPEMGLALGSVTGMGAKASCLDMAGSGPAGFRRGNAKADLHRKLLYLSPTTHSGPSVPNRSSSWSTQGKVVQIF